MALDATRASLLKHSIWLLLGNTTLGLLSIPFLIPSASPLVYVISFTPFYLLLFSSLWLLHRGSRQAAAWTLVVGVFLLQGLGNFFNSGGAEQAMASFINLILLAGFALSRRAGMATAGVALVGMVAYLLMYDQGMLPPPIFPLSLQERIPIMGLTVLTTGGLVAIAVTHVTWAFNQEQKTRRQAQASSASLAKSLAENDLRARLSGDLVGMGRRLLTSTKTSEHLGLLADTLVAVDGLHAVSLLGEDGTVLVERGWDGQLPPQAEKKDVTLEGLHHRYIIRVHGTTEFLRSDAAADFYRAAAGLLSTAEARLEAERKLQSADQLQAIARLAAGVAHDFNNVLVSIQGGLELAQLQLQRGENPRAQLSSASHATERAVRLTRKMGFLTDSREQTRTPTRLAPVLQDLCESMQDSLPEGVKLVLWTPLPQVRLVADRVEFEQIVLNLVNNALYAIPDAGTITLEARVPNELPGTVRVDVRDTGTGMPPGVLERIFEPFYTTRVDAGGHGLGLTGVRSLVERLDGKIAVESTVGHGSLFSVWLPLAAGASAESTRDEQPGDSSRGPLMAPLTGQYVLLVDDEPDVRDVVAALLESLGAVVHIVESGEQALEGLDSIEGITLLLTDVRMPEMDGHELLRRARAAGHQLPAVLASGFDPQDPSDSAGLQPYSRLAKPFKRAQLLDALLALLGTAEDS